MDKPSSVKDNSVFYYDSNRTALEIPNIELRVMSGEASEREASEVMTGYLDYIFSILSDVDNAYMNRSKELPVGARLSKVNDGISVCLDIISRGKYIFRHYPLCLRVLGGVYSAVRFQDVFTVSAINEELNSSSYFEQDSFSIH